MTSNKLDREHVTLHIRKNPNLFSKINLLAHPELHWPSLGLTLDEDWVVENMSVVAFVSNTNSYQIIQAEEKYIME